MKKSNNKDKSTRLKERDKNNDSEDVYYYSTLIPRQNELTDEFIKSCTTGRSCFIGIERKCKCVILASIPTEKMLTGFCLIEILIDKNNGGNFVGCQFMVEQFFKVLEQTNNITLNRMSYVLEKSFRSNKSKNPPFFSSLSRLYNVQHVCEILRKNLVVRHVTSKETAGKCSHFLGSSLKKSASSTKKLHVQNTGGEMSLDQPRESVTYILEVVQQPALKFHPIATNPQSQEVVKGKIGDLKLDGRVLQFSHYGSLVLIPTKIEGKLMMTGINSAQRSELEDLRTLPPLLWNVEERKIDLDEEGDLEVLVFSNEGSVSPLRTTLQSFENDYVDLLKKQEKGKERNFGGEMGDFVGIEIVGELGGLVIEIDSKGELSKISIDNMSTKIQRFDGSTGNCRRTKSGTFFEFLQEKNERTFDLESNTIAASLLTAVEVYMSHDLRDGDLECSHVAPLEEKYYDYDDFITKCHTQVHEQTEEGSVSKEPWSISDRNVAVSNRLIINTGERRGSRFLEKEICGETTENDSSEMSARLLAIVSKSVECSEIVALQSCTFVRFLDLGESSTEAYHHDKFLSLAESKWTLVNRGCEFFLSLHLAGKMRQICFNVLSHFYVTSYLSMLSNVCEQRIKALQRQVTVVHFFTQIVEQTFESEHGLDIISEGLQIRTLLSQKHFEDNKEMCVKMPDVCKHPSLTFGIEGERKESGVSVTLMIAYVQQLLLVLKEFEAQEYFIGRLNASFCEYTSPNVKYVQASVGDYTFVANYQLSCTREMLEEVISIDITCEYLLRTTSVRPEFLCISSMTDCSVPYEIDKREKWLKDNVEELFQKSLPMDTFEEKSIYFLDREVVRPAKIIGGDSVKMVTISFKNPLKNHRESGEIISKREQLRERTMLKNCIDKSNVVLQRKSPRFNTHEVRDKRMKYNFLKKQQINLKKVVQKRTSLTKIGEEFHRPRGCKFIFRTGSDDNRRHLVCDLGRQCSKGEMPLDSGFTAMMVYDTRQRTQRRVVAKESLRRKLRHSCRSINADVSDNIRNHMLNSNRNNRNQSGLKLSMQKDKRSLLYSNKVKVNHLLLDFNKTANDGFVKFDLYRSWEAKKSRNHHLENVCPRWNNVIHNVIEILLSESHQNTNFQTSTIAPLISSNINVASGRASSQYMSSDDNDDVLIVSYETSTSGHQQRNIRKMRASFDGTSRNISKIFDDTNPIENVIQVSVDMDQSDRSFGKESLSSLHNVIVDNIVTEHRKDSSGKTAQMLDKMVQNGPLIVGQCPENEFNEAEQILLEDCVKEEINANTNLVSTEGWMTRIDVLLKQMMLNGRLNS